MLRGRATSIVLSVALLWSGALVLALPAQADSQARIVRLSYLSGDVQVDREGVDFERALRNMPIIENMRLWAGPDSRAEVEFEDGSTLRLVDNTMVEFVELRLRSDAVRLNHVLVEQGTAYFDIDRKDAQDFRVTFGNRIAFVPRESRFRVHVLQDHASLAVTHGEVAMTGAQGSTLTVRRGETVTLDIGDRDRYYVAGRISALPFDNWAEDRRKQRGREVQVARASAAQPAYYAYDLHHYGSYFHHPVYGSLWRPYGVAVGWHPFAHGAWVWYPAYGYVWVSAYPWGWTPYRYGTWMYVGGYGWSWRPALSFSFITWHRSPRYLYAPHGWRAPRAPRTVVNTTVIVGVDRSRRWGGGWDRYDGQRNRTYTRDDSAARTWRERRERDGFTRTAGATRDAGRSGGERSNGRRDGDGRWGSRNLDGSGSSDSGTGAVSSAPTATRDTSRWSDRSDRSDRTDRRERSEGRERPQPAGVENGGESRTRGEARAGWQRNPMPRNNGQAESDSGSEARASRRGGDSTAAPAPQAAPQRTWRTAPEGRPERNRPDVQGERSRPASSERPQARPERSQPAPSASREVPATRPAPSARPEARPERSQPAPQEAPAAAPSNNFARGESSRPAPRAERPAPAPQRSAPSAERAAPQPRSAPRQEAPAVAPGNNFVRGESSRAAPRAERSAPASNFTRPSRGDSAPAASREMRMPSRSVSAPSRTVSAPSRGMSAPSPGSSSAGRSGGASPSRGGGGGGSSRRGGGPRGD